MRQYSRRARKTVARLIITHIAGVTTGAGSPLVMRAAIAAAAAAAGSSAVPFAAGCRCCLARRPRSSIFNEEMQRSPVRGQSEMVIGRPGAEKRDQVHGTAAGSRRYQI